MGTPLTSTEIFIHGHTSWTEVGELPFPVMYGRGTVSIDNLIIATGHMISNVVLDNLHIYFALPTYLTGGFNGYDSAGNWVGQTSGHKDTILRFDHGLAAVGGGGGHVPPPGQPRPQPDQGGGRAAVLSITMLINTRHISVCCMYYSMAPTEDIRREKSYI